VARFELVNEYEFSLSGSQRTQVTAQIALQPKAKMGFVRDIIVPA
jgi:hypothetical protein